MKNEFSIKRNKQSILRNLKKTIVAAVSIVIAFIFVTAISDVILKTLSDLYDFASDRKMTFYDLAIFGGFFGGVIGVFVANFAKICKAVYRVIMKSLDCLSSKRRS